MPWNLNPTLELTTEILLRGYGRFGGEGVRLEGVSESTDMDGGEGDRQERVGGSEILGVKGASILMAVTVLH